MTLKDEGGQEDAKDEEQSKQRKKGLTEREVEGAHKKHLGLTSRENKWEF